MPINKKYLWSALLVAVLSASIAEAQQANSLLLSEDFNACALPAGWQVRLLGDTLTPLWYVGWAQVPDALGQSIDGTCFFFIDGSAGGKLAPAHVLELISPPFDGSGFDEIPCRMDIHFKFGDADILEVLATNGAQEHLLARYDNYATNYGALNSGDVFRFRADLTFLPWVGPTRIVLRYTSPQGSEGRYAGIDNIAVTGTGNGTIVFKESFDSCSAPVGWQGEVLSGSAGWSFGRVPLGSSAFYEGSSMNGTCFAFFDDNFQGDNAPPTRIRLYSPWFSGTAFMEYELRLDAIMRYSGYESLAIFLENGQGQTVALFSSEGQVFGPFFPNYGRLSFSLSTYRSAQWRLVFEYSDGGTRGYWVGIDNVKVVGHGDAMDFCHRAKPLLTGGPCSAAENLFALYDGPINFCSVADEGSLWFRWLADFDGMAKLTTAADFNDLVSVFSGSCGDLQWLLCVDRDEHGFEGETAYFPVQSGKEYYIRVTGVRGTFGRSRGALCVQIAPANQVPVPPPNDDCSQAQVLAPDAPCPQGTNRHATTSAQLPSHNRLARADVWYAFHAPTLAPGEVLELDAQANFSHILTVYSSTCQTLSEVATRAQGSPLRLPPLTPGQLYYAQVAGVFATVEGDLCPTLRIHRSTPPPNDDCLSARPLSVNAPCSLSTTAGAGFSGIQPPCLVRASSDVWFLFQAPTSGAVRVNTGAAFDHVVAVWEGACAALKPVFCSDQTRYCQGSLIVSSLNAGQTYYLQVAARAGTAAAELGVLCLTLEDAAHSDAYEPLALEVKQLCVGKDSVRLLVNPTGGTPPYSYWADTANQVVASGQRFGVVVRDARGCETYFSEVAKSCEQNACTGVLSFDLVAPSCFGAADGAIIAGISAGTGPFFFEWSNGVYTATNPQLTAGTYTLLVSETTGCTYTAQVTLAQPDSIGIVVDSLKHPNQGQSNGFISVSVQGGTPPWSYRWTNKDGAVVSHQPQLMDVAAGTYLLEVTDDRGCTATAIFELEGSVRAAEIDRSPQVFVFPNPASDDLQVRIIFPTPTAIEMCLLDLLGRPYIRWAAPAVEREWQHRLDVKALPSGTYLLSLRTPDGAWCRRVVVGH